jgi:hypothetical protein
VLNALFYDSVVVTEGDADRAFYQEINERLIEEGTSRGVPNCLFLNAQSKQTIKDIVNPLREMGIPTAGILDIDVLKDGGKEWCGLLESGFFPQLQIGLMSNFRKSIKDSFEVLGKDMKINGGIDLLDQSSAEAAKNLFDMMDQYGLFVVRRGELESWLPEIGATGHGPRWLVSVFESLGEDPSSPTYIRPTQEDVWSFVESVAKWLSEPSRKGIPEHSMTN